MGVITGTKDLFGYESPGNMDIIEPGMSSSDEEPVVRQVRRRPQPQRQRNMQTDLQMAEHVYNRRTGAKQARRTDNLKDLINMVEKDDLELDFNVFEPSMSVFAELFSEREKMQVWNDFVNSTEEEQIEILHRENRKLRKSGSDNNGNDTARDEDDGFDTLEEIKDKRSTHPSFSAEQCFQKLDRNIRMLLKRRQRPMGMLVGLEEDLISFFKEWPTSVYISSTATSYERMLLHALCQYLDLLSKSFDCDGSRKMQVENPESDFTPPPVLLTQYLEQQGHKS